MRLQTASREAEPANREDRLALARATLGAAERSASRWGGRIDRTALRTATTPATQAATTGEVEQGLADDGMGTRVPVPGPLADLFPRGSLRAGSSVAITGAASTSLLLSLAVAAVGEDSWCAIAGMPDLGLRSAVDAGLDPCRLAHVPAHGEQRPQVLSALADGVDVLVLGPDLDLAPALWRSLLGRARAADTLVLAAVPPGRADLTLRSTTLRWTGLGAGSGRLRTRRLEVLASGRGIAGQREVEVLLPQVGGMIAAAPQQRIRHEDQAVPTPVRLLEPVRRAG